MGPREGGPLPPAPRPRGGARGHPREDDLQEGVTFEEYQFARLCHYLRSKRPAAEVAYTFLIFRLTDAEVMRALLEPVNIP